MVATCSERDVLSFNFFSVFYYFILEQGLKVETHETLFIKKYCHLLQCVKYSIMFVKGAFCNKFTFNTIFGLFVKNKPGTRGKRRRRRLRKRSQNPTNGLTD